MTYLDLLDTSAITALYPWMVVLSAFLFPVIAGLFVLQIRDDRLPLITLILREDAEYRAPGDGPAAAAPTEYRKAA